MWFLFLYTQFSMFELQSDTPPILFLEGENLIMSPLSIICDKRNNVLSQFWSYNQLKCVNCVLEAGSLKWIDWRVKKKIPETIKPDYVFDFLFDLRSVNPSAALHLCLFVCVRAHVCVRVRAWRAFITTNTDIQFNLAKFTTKCLNEDHVVDACWKWL